MTAEEQELKLMAEALARIRREHVSWIKDRVWLDDAYLVAVLRSVARRSVFRSHGVGALARLKAALESKARGLPRSVRGFTNVAEESRRVASILAARLGDSPPPRFPDPLKGSPSVYYYVRGRGGRRVVIRVSDHPPDRRAHETLIDISPTGHSAFSAWFTRRLDELGVNRDLRDGVG